MTYPGLPRATVDFLAALAVDNRRDWFEAHRDLYERDWLAAGLDLVAAVAAALPDRAPGLLAVPRLNQSLRRLNRDVRFAADKRPYEPALHLILSTGPAFNKVPGFHFVLRPDGLSYGGGWYGLGPADLDRYRRRVADSADRARLVAALAQAEKTGSTLDPPTLARVPAGFAADPDWDHLLRRKGVIARTQAPLAVPDWLFSSEAPARIAELAAAHLPLLDWLTDRRTPAAG